MKAHLNRERDRELYKLSQYLKEIAKLDDFSGLNHKHWERYALIEQLNSIICIVVVAYFKPTAPARPEQPFTRKYEIY